MDTPGASGLESIIVVPASSEYPPFEGEPESPPDPEEPPVDAELEARVDALEAQMTALTAAAVHIDGRVDVIESDMTTLG